MRRLTSITNVTGIALVLASAAPVAAVAAPSALDHPAFARKLHLGAAYRVDRQHADSRSICGERDLQFVNAYDGALGQPQNYVALHKFPVGALTSSNDGDGAKYCSGTLVAPDLFLTASHCIDGNSINDFVAFNYEFQAGGTTVAPQDFRRVLEIVESGDADNGVDYGILRLDGNPGMKWGWAAVRTAQASEGELLTIIQHPGGNAKQVEIGHLLDFDGDYLRYGDLDTEPGSSGSGILDSHGNVIGVHTNGGCTETDGANSGVRLSAVADSATLARLNGLTLPFSDGAAIELQVVVGGRTLALAGDAISGAVSLVAPNQASRWRVSDLQDGAFQLSMDVEALGTFALVGAADGSVRLVPGADGASPGVRWRIVAREGGEVVIRAAVTNEPRRWLGAGTDGTTIGLEATATGWRAVL